jgi:hypothetical protein
MLFVWCTLWKFLLIFKNSSEFIRMSKDTNSPSEETAPSMEEILRTIRGVISGNKSDKPEEALADAAQPEQAEDEDEDVLELGADMALEEENEEEEISSSRVEGEEDVLENIDALLANKTASDSDVDLNADENFNETIEEKSNFLAEEEIKQTAEENTIDNSFSLQDETPAEEPKSQPAAPAEKKPQAALDSAAIISAETARATRDAFSALKHQAPRTHVDGPVLRSGISLEDLVIEALRPYLADWLEHNLPSLVRQLVEKEIRRLVPGDEQ